MRIAMLLQRILTCLAMGLLLMAAPVQAGTAAIDIGNASSQEFSSHAEIFIDESGALDVQAVAAMTDAFRKVAPADLNRRYDGRTFWLRATVHNTSAEKIERWIGIGHARLENASLFQQGAQGWQSVDSGVRVPRMLKAVDAVGVVLPFTLEASEHRQILLRVQSRTAIDLDARLWRPTSFLQAEDARQLMIASGAGGSLIVAFISLSVFARLRQRTYLYFSLLHVSTALLELGREGLWERYLWPVSLAFPIHLHVAVGLTAALSLLFIQRDFLDMRATHPRWDRVFLVLVGISLVSTLISPFNYGLWNEVWSRTLLVIIVLTLTVATMAWRRGDKSAGYLALSYSVAWVVEGLRAVSNLGFVHLPFTHYTSLTWALLVAAPMFFLALSEQSRKLQTQLVQSRQLSQAKTDFLARVSHELHAPLNTIIGYARMLRRGSPRLTLKEGTTDIERNGLRLLTMIDELLDQSRLESGHLTLQPKPLALHAWLDELERSGAVMAETGGNVFALTRKRDLPEGVLVDAQRLRQVLDNLISNANRHTRDGRIELVCEATAARSAKTVQLIFLVNDNGAGIAQNDQQHIFEPFFQGVQRTKSHRGIGLGLSIANDLVRLMGGALKVSSTEGKGSTFSFALEFDLVAVDLQTQVESAKDRAASFDEAGAGLHLRVLLAEDDPHAMRTMIDSLELLGCTMVSVSSGQQAIAQMARMRENLTHFDVVVTDQIMAEGDGWDVLRYARAHCPDLPVILVSGLNPQRPDDAPETLQFDASLRKPYGQQDLARLLAGIRTAARALRRPDAKKLASLLSLVRLGEVSAIEEWSDQLEVEAPEFAAFATEVRKAVRQIDFDRLAVLAAAGRPA
jgi:signal transduction histidine kinase/DNA-binding response OmpR family regulator